LSGKRLKVHKALSYSEELFSTAGPFQGLVKGSEDKKTKTEKRQEREGVLRIED